MNTENENTVPDRDELERITAPKSSMKLADADGDPELRETWLAMGALLDRHTPPKVEVDEPRIRAALLNRRDEQFHSGRAALLAGLALAASVIFAIWIMHGIIAKDLMQRQNIAKVPNAPARRPTSQHAPRPAVIEVAWDDRMTGRIAQVHTGVRHLHGPATAASASTQSTRHDDRVDALRARISNLQRAWGANQL